LKELPPFYIAAQQQTKGRGRLGRQWHSPKGNIYFTACFSAKEIPLSRLPLFTLFAALKVCDALNRRYKKEKLWLKWPNDLWWGKRKVAGLLAEAPLDKKHGRVLLLGLGLNCDKMPLPADIRKSAGSLEAAFGRVVQKNEITELLCDEVGSAFEAFRTQKFEESLYELWLRYGKLMGRQIRYEESGLVKKGTVVGLGADGELCVKDKNKITTLRSGEVTLSKFLR